MAYEYAISFEIKADSGYSERYQSLMDQIRKNTESVWAETTSFVLVRCNERIEDLADRLYFSTKLSAVTDKLLVIDHVLNVAIARGLFEYPNTLKSHFKTCVIK